jgi:hypothetical protein
MSEDALRGWFGLVLSCSPYGICDAAGGGHGRSRRGHFRERLPRPPFPAGERGRLSLACNFVVYDL